MHTLSHKFKHLSPVFSVRTDFVFLKFTHRSLRGTNLIYALKTSELALRQIFIPVLLFSAVIIIPTLLITYLYVRTFCCYQKDKLEKPETLQQAIRH